MVYLYVASVPNVSSVFLDVLLQVCLSECCIRFTHVLQVLYMDIAYVCNGFEVFYVFLQVFQKYVSSVSLIIFKRMLQVLHLDVLKVDRMLHILQCK
jgi:hypothetical protein